MGIPPQILQKQTSSTDFIDLTTYTEELEWNERTKMEYYAANIITEIQRSFVDSKTARKLETKKNFITFVFDKAKKIKNALTPKERLDNSKSVWLSLFGIKDKNHKD